MRRTVRPALFVPYGPRLTVSQRPISPSAIPAQHCTLQDRRRHLCAPLPRVRGRARVDLAPSREFHARVPLLRTAPYRAWTRVVRARRA